MIITTIPMNRRTIPGLLPSFSCRGAAKIAPHNAKIAPKRNRISYLSMKTPSLYVGYEQKKGLGLVGLG